MRKLFFFCLFVAAVPWTQAEARGGHAVIIASSGHSGTVSGAPDTHTNKPTIVQVPQVNMRLKASKFRDESRLLNDPLNNNPIFSPPGQEMRPLPEPKPSVAPMSPMGSTVETATQTAVNGFTVSQVRQVQAALHRLGYYNGPVDGDFGLHTQTAVESYQIHSGGPVTGTLTLGVLSSLGVGGTK
jgi:hypothetical protein